MAGDWIAIRPELIDEPKVISISVDTGIDVYGVVGRLLRVWGWFGTHTLKGNAPSVTETYLNALVGNDAFIQAMKKVEWIEQKDGSIAVHNYDAYNSKSAKRRLLTARRVAKHKAQKGNAGSVTDALPTEQNSDSAVLKDYPQPIPRITRQPTGRKLTGDDADAVLEKRKGTNNCANNGEVSFRVATIMGDRGCDKSFRDVYRKIAPISIVERVANHYDKIAANIKNPGAWWRRQLNKAGVQA
jgi:hypothetical protein